MLINDSVYRLQDGWMQRNARSLDLARWRFLNNQVDAKSVLDALYPYQNEDGGFGHALEPDCWNPNSSPLQTWTATTILRELNLFDPKIPLISRLIQYLMATLSNGVWQTVIPSNNDHPRAPWWTFEPATALWEYNPTAGLLGFLARIGTVLDAEIERALESFFSRPIDNMHELRLFIELCEDLEQIGWPGTDLERMRLKLKQDCRAVIEPDAEKWSGYVTRPSAIIRNRLPSYLSFLQPLVEQEKAYLLGSVGEEGTWDVSWDWGQFPEQFAIAKNWWKASLIIQYHHFLGV